MAAGGKEPPQLAKAFGVARKALIEIDGATCLSRVLGAVRDAAVERCVTVTGIDAASEVTFGEFVQEAGDAMENVLVGMDRLGEEVNALLLLPADAPFLHAAHLRQFAAAIESRAKEERWYAAGLCPARRWKEQFPDAPAKTLRLREGAFLSGALYAASPAGIRHSLEWIRTMIGSRKSRLSMARKLGARNLISYATGRLTISDAERFAGNVLAGQVIVWPEAPPTTCFDIDTPADLAAARRVVALGLFR